MKSNLTWRWKSNFVVVWTSFHCSLTSRCHHHLQKTNKHTNKQRVEEQKKTQSYSAHVLMFLRSPRWSFKVITGRHVVILLHIPSIFVASRRVAIKRESVALVLVCIVLFAINRCIRPLFLLAGYQAEMKINNIVGEHQLVKNSTRITRYTREAYHNVMMWWSHRFHLHVEHGGKKSGEISTQQFSFLFSFWESYGEIRVALKRNWRSERTKKAKARVGMLHLFRICCHGMFRVVIYFCIFLIG